MYLYKGTDNNITFYLDTDNVNQTARIIQIKINKYLFG